MRFLTKQDTQNVVIMKIQFYSKQEKNKLCMMTY